MKSDYLLEQYYTQDQPPRKRNGMALTAGIISVITAAFMFLLVLMFALMLISAPSEVVGTEVYTEIVMMFSVYIVMLLGYCILALVAGIKFIKQYSKVVDYPELAQVRGRYIAWVIVFFLFVGILPGIFALIPLCTPKNNNVAYTANSNIDIAATEADLEGRINMIKDMRDRRLITSEECSNLIVELIRKKL